MNPAPEALRERAARVELLVLDVDGVLTDGTLAYSAEGEVLKRFHAQDGLGIRLAQANRIAVAVISARSSAALTRRLDDLQIAHRYLGRASKLAAIDELTAALGLPRDRVAYVGDDVLDLPALAAVGLPITVADGHPLVCAQADWVTRAPGGRGAVREVIDGLIASRRDLAEAVREYLELRARTEREAASR